MSKLFSVRVTSVLLYFILLTLMLIGKTQAQNLFIVKAGLGLPMGDFNDGSFIETLGKDRFNSAAPGFSLGAYLRHEIAPSTALYFSADAFYNGLDASYRDEWEEYFSENFFEWDIVFPRYLNFPISGGISYAIEINNGNLILLDAGINVHFLKILPMKMEYTTMDHKRHGEIYYNWGYNVGFMIAAAYQLNDKLFLHVDYFPLGRVKITMFGEYVDFDENNEVIYKDEITKAYRQPVELLRIGLGFKL